MTFLGGQFRRLRPALTWQYGVIASAIIVAIVVGSWAVVRSISTPTRRVATASPTPTVTSPGGTLKAPLAGLLTRSGPPPAGYLAVMGGYAVNVYWRDLQASPGAPIAPANAIDQAIEQLHQVDSGGRLALKIRLFAGIYAPDWAKSLGGAPIPIADPTTGVSGTIGRFWNDDFGAAYADLQTKLAAKYDASPEIREITISRCTTVFAEPFIRDISYPANVSALLHAGFTVEADQRCHREEIAAHAVWVHTRSDLSFNPYQVVGGTFRTDESFTEDMMALCRSTLGKRCVLANNSLRTPLQFPEMYARIQALGPPIAFQTATLNKIGPDLGSTIDAAISLGAESVELPSGFESIPESALVSYDNRLVANATAAGSP